MSVSSGRVGIPGSEKQTRRAALFSFAAGVVSLLVVNIQHYSLAAWGFCKLDPDYPLEFRVFPKHITDSVFEYRTYFFLFYWALALAGFWPDWFCFFCIGCWLAASWKRAAYFKTGLSFWRQAAKESPRKLRVLTRYAEELMKEIERKYKAPGVTWQEIGEVAEAQLIVERIARLGRVGRIMGGHSEN